MRARTRGLLCPARRTRGAARPGAPVTMFLTHGGGLLIQPTSEDFRKLLHFRVTLRSFLSWSKEQAAGAGLTSAQHQLLVAIKGHPGPQPPAVREIAAYLLLRSHSAVGLVDRAEAAGLVRRTPDPGDARVARVALTARGDKLVTDLSSAHLARLYELAAALNDLLPADE